MSETSSWDEKEHWQAMSDIHDALDVVNEFRDRHKWLSRKIDCLGYSGAPEEDGYEWSLRVYLRNGSPLPPKFASAINSLLEDAGLKHVSVQYTHNP
jgi:hypothetical protein